MIPEEKLTYERKLVGDLWEFRKKFYIPDSTDGYWVDLVKAADELQTAYRGSVYASALIRANIEDFERRAEVGSNSGLMLVQLDEGGKMPCRMTEGAAGSDLCSVNTVVIMPGDTEVVHTGVHVRPQKGTAGLLFIRSSFSKVGLGLSTGVSVIDAEVRQFGNKMYL